MSIAPRGTSPTAPVGSSTASEPLRRLVDLVFAVFWLILLAPLMLAVAVAIRLDSPGSVLYTPLVIGLNGKPFRMYRFRNMYVDWRDRSPGNRRTPVMRFIQHYSPDFPPILFNLLKGEFTLVGPRAQEAEAVDLRDPAWARYCSVKPGVFCYAVLRMGKTYGHWWKDNRAQKLA
jgi:lipopolysaccharide/colanic/teichoic acid biosynthesis glycosyltransferase